MIQACFRLARRNGRLLCVGDPATGDASAPRVFRIAIPASDIAVSRAFYEAVLGLDVDATVPSRLYFHCGPVILAVIDWSIEGRGALRPTPDDLYLATGELDAVFERARAAAARITSPIEARPWGERSFYCLDPDGNRLCFVDDSTLFLGRGAPWA
jgi:catechol 2,3-dioxygenase-like lactoylglutathione lyase family enzyme